MDDFEALEQEMEAANGIAVAVDTDCPMGSLGHLSRGHFESGRSWSSPIDCGNAAMASLRCQAATMLSHDPHYLCRMSFFPVYRLKRRLAAAALAHSSYCFGPFEMNSQPHN